MLFYNVDKYLRISCVCLSNVKPTYLGVLNFPQNLLLFLDIKLLNIDYKKFNSIYLNTFWKFNAQYIFLALLS